MKTWKWNRVLEKLKLSYLVGAQTCRRYLRFMKTTQKWTINKVVFYVCELLQKYCLFIRAYRVTYWLNWEQIESCYWSPFQIFDGHPIYSLYAVIHYPHLVGLLVRFGHYFYRFLLFDETLCLTTDSVVVYTTKL